MKKDKNEAAESNVVVWIHMMYSTKDCTGFLEDEDTRSYAYLILGTLHNEYGAPALAIGGTADHVHILCSLAIHSRIENLVFGVRRNSSKEIQNISPKLAKFEWDDAYGVFSVSASGVPQIRKHIKNQDEYHRDQSFHEEFQEFTRKANKVSQDSLGQTWLENLKT